MRLVTLILATAIVGVGVGVVWGYLDVRPAAPTEALMSELSAEDAEGAHADHPHMVVDNAEHDFGAMQRGTSRSHTFVVSNSGGAPLRIELGQPTCKCTVGELESNVLQPGESVDVEVNWKAQAAEGPFRQTVPILALNDPLHSRLELSVVGEITEPTGLMPSEFVFGKITAGESRTAAVELMAYLQDSVEISEAQISSEEAREHFDVEVVQLSPDELPDEKAAAGVSLVLTAKESLPIGRFTQWLDLKTNIPAVSELTVPIVGQVVGDISIAGQGWSEEHGVLRLGRVSSVKGKHSDLNVIVRGEHAADIEIEVAATQPPELKATLGEPRKYKDALFHVPLRVEVPVGTRPMAHLNPNIHEPASVTLKTSHPQAPELELEVRFTVADN